MSLSEIWSSWIVLAFFAPLAWSIVSMIEVFMIDRGIFKNAEEATIITVLMSLLPIAIGAYISAETDLVDIKLVVFSCVSGALYVAHTYLFFKVLLRWNDATHAESFMNVSIVIVPVFAFLIFDETLSHSHYAGIALATLGVALISFPDKGSGNKKTGLLVPLLMSVSCLSLSLLLQDSVFNETDYWTGMFWFSIGAIGAAMLLLARTSFERTFRTAWDNRFCLSMTQLLSCAALLTSLRSTDLSSTVTVVVLIESIVPVLIMFYSAGILLGSKVGMCRSARVIKTLDQQIQAPIRKAASSVCILSGIYFAATASLTP